MTNKDELLAVQALMIELNRQDKKPYDITNIFFAYNLQKLRYKVLLSFFVFFAFILDIATFKFVLI